VFENKNQYVLQASIDETGICYFVSFIDGQGIWQKAEVSLPIYQAFQQFVRTERNLRRWDERHIAGTLLEDSVVRSTQSAEDVVIKRQRCEEVRKAIRTLPKIQHRRFVLRYGLGFTYEKIARIEGCSFQQVAKAIKAAKNKIKKYFSK